MAVKRDVIFENETHKLVRFTNAVSILHIYDQTTNQLDKDALARIKQELVDEISKEPEVNGRMPFTELSDHTNWFSQQTIRWLYIDKTGKSF
jgi:hypothetical protein